MATFKFGVSLFFMVLVSLCFSLPVDLPTTDNMISSSTEEQHSVRTAEVNEILSSVSKRIDRHVSEINELIL